MCLKTAPLSSPSAPCCLCTQTHLQRKPTCDARSHAAGEEAPELCAMNTRTAFFFFFFLCRKCQNCALRAKACRWMRSSFTKSSKKRQRGLQVELKIIPETQPKLKLMVRFSAGSAGEPTSESGKQDSSEQQMMCRGLAA